MSETELSALMQQVINGQNTLFKKVDESAKATSSIASSVAVLQERQSDDRSAILRIGNEMDSCRSGCHRDIREASVSLTSLGTRITKLESSVSGRGVVLTWVVNLATSALLVIAAWKFKG